MWPKDLLDAFDVALQDVGLAEGYTKAAALVKFLDAAAAMAVARCRGNAEHLMAAYFTPYTPIGQLTAAGMAGTMTRFALAGDRWGHALDALKACIQTHAADSCRAFENVRSPYPDDW